MMFKDIMILNNVISEQKCDNIINLFKPLEWETSTLATNVENKARLSKQISFSKYNNINGVSKLDKELYKLWNSKIINYCTQFQKILINSDEGYTILKYNPKDHYKLHIDSDLKNAPRLVSGLLYLNNDFEGGELHFPRQSIKVKPEPGKMVLFPSGFTHPHEALPVTKGVKYAIVTWFS